MAWSQTNTSAQTGPTSSAHSQSGPTSSAHSQSFNKKVVKGSGKLKYIGGTSLTLRGNISRKIYQFYSPQVVLEIEPEDLNSIASNPFLVRVL
jgi:hypothetical protein